MIVKDGDSPVYVASLVIALDTCSLPATSYNELSIVSIAFYSVHVLCCNGWVSWELQAGARYMYLM